MKHLLLIAIAGILFMSCTDERRQEDFMQGYIAGYLRHCKEMGVEPDFEKFKLHWTADSITYFKYEIRK